MWRRLQQRFQISSECDSRLLLEMGTFCMCTSPNEFLRTRLLKASVLIRTSSRDALKDRRRNTIPMYLEPRYRRQFRDAALQGPDYIRVPCGSWWIVVWNVDLAAIKLGLGDRVVTREHLDEDRFYEATRACARVAKPVSGRHGE